MANLNARVITTRDGIQIHLLTRGRAKPVSEEEMMEYCKENGLEVSNSDDEEEDWKPVNPKMFLIDLRSGLAFCSSKYGVPESVIEKYLKVMAPHINESFYNRGKTNG